jgi:hypothetical protein
MKHFKLQVDSMSGLFNRASLSAEAPTTHTLVLQTLSHFLFCAFHVSSCFCQAIDHCKESAVILGQPLLNSRFQKTTK